MVAQNPDKQLRSTSRLSINTSFFQLPPNQTTYPDGSEIIQINSHWFNLNSVCLKVICIQCVVNSMCSTLRVWLCMSASLRSVTPRVFLAKVPFFPNNMQVYHPSVQACISTLGLKDRLFHLQATIFLHRD